jgi:uncharacterized membrane protein
VALSGGMGSVVLIDLLSKLSAKMQFTLSALSTGTTSIIVIVEFATLALLSDMQVMIMRFWLHDMPCTCRHEN